jgi:hypothetical protein
VQDQHQEPLLNVAEVIGIDLSPIRRYQDRNWFPEQFGKILGIDPVPLGVIDPDLLRGILHRPDVSDLLE